MNIRRKSRVGRLTIRLFALFCVGLANSHGEPVRVVGSDLLGDGFKQALEEFAKEQGMALEVKLAGSLLGRRALERGQAEVALISLAPGDPDFGPGYSMKPFAYHLAVVQARRELALERLSYVQLREIFGPAKAGAHKRWREYGAQGAGSTRRVKVGYAEGKNGLSQVLFHHALGLTKDPGSEPHIEPESEEDELDLVLVSPRPPSSVGDWVSVSISREPRGRAFLPTGSDVEQGNYPLSWPIHLVFRSNQVELLYPLLRFLLSNEIARHLEQGRLMPLPEGIRQERIFEFESL